MVEGLESFREIKLFLVVEFGKEVDRGRCHRSKWRTD